jgi:hypothetical protein
LWQSPQSFHIDIQHYPGALRVGLKPIATAPPYANKKAAKSHFLAAFLLALGVIC